MMHQLNNIWMKRIKNSLLRRCERNEYRHRIAVNSGNCKWLFYQGKKYLNFSSNDYLGLSCHPKIINAWKEGASKLGVGSGGSAYINGYSFYHKNLEYQLANWLGFDRAIIFTSGFAANQALINTLIKKGDYIILDRFSHASLIEASIHSSAKIYRFAHNDINELNFLANRFYGKNIMFVTEGVFSMDGTQAPISELVNINKKYKGLLLLDDAHGIGVLGKYGQGSVANKKFKPDILVITFGKAFGVSGAAVLCSLSVAEYLIQFSRHLIYSTSLPPAQIYTIIYALKLIKNGEHLRVKLKENIKNFRKGANDLGINLLSSDTAIQPIIIKDDDLLLNAVKFLKDKGIWLVPIRSPTVPYGCSRLRITLTANHSLLDINKLLELLYVFFKNARKRL